MGYRAWFSACGDIYDTIVFSAVCDCVIYAIGDFGCFGNLGTFSYIALVIVGVSLAKLLFELAQNIITAKTEYAQYRVSNQMMYLWQWKRRDRDWSHEFNPDVQKSDERSQKAFQSSNTAGTHFPMDFANIIAALLNFLLFSSVISLLNPLIVVFLALGCMLNYYADKWRREKNLSDKDVRNDLVKKLNYSTRDISIHFKYAKDLRA